MANIWRHWHCQACLEASGRDFLWLNSKRHMLSYTVIHLESKSTYFLLKYVISLSINWEKSPCMPCIPQSHSCKKSRLGPAWSNELLYVQTALTHYTASTNRFFYLSLELGSKQSNEPTKQASRGLCGESLHLLDLRRTCWAVSRLQNIGDKTKLSQLGRWRNRPSHRLPSVQILYWQFDLIDVHLKTRPTA